MKFLVFTTDVIPLPGLATSGTALRTWGLIQGLRSLGHEVTVSVPQPALENVLKNTATQSLPSETTAALQELKRLSFDSTNQSKVIAETGPEVIICGHWPALTLSTKPSQTLVIDLAGPHLLERHYQQSPNQIDAVRGKLSVLSRADYYIVSGPSQRLYFLSFLLRAGIKNAEKRIAQISMPLDPNLPAHRGSAAERFPNFVFGGVFLPWQDPSAGLEQLSGILTERNAGNLTLIGGPHPNYKLKEGVYERLFEGLSANPRVTTHPMLPYASFIDLLCEQDVALDVMRWNLERQLAVTIRSTTYLWSGTPVIYNDFADLAHVIKRYDAGWCVDPNDPQALRQVCEEIYGNPAVVRQKSVNAQQLARMEFAWDRAVQPLLGLLGETDATPMAETDIILDFPESAALTIGNDTPVEQQFVCRAEGLNRVEVRLATHGEDASAPLVLSLYEVRGGAGGKKGAAREHVLVKRKELQPAAISNNQWHAIDCDPIANSAGKTFALKIELDGKHASSKLSPWALRGAPYPMSGLYCGNKLLDGQSLCFRTTCVS